MKNYGTEEKKRKVEHVTNVMRENIKNVAERDTRLNEIEETAVNLSKLFRIEI